MARQRRSFSTEFKREAASLVLGQGYSLAATSCSEDVGANTLARWVKQPPTKPGRFSTPSWRTPAKMFCTFSIIFTVLVALLSWTNETLLLEQHLPAEVISLSEPTAEDQDESSPLGDISLAENWTISEQTSKLPISLFANSRPYYWPQGPPST